MSCNRGAVRAPHLVFTFRILPVLHHTHAWYDVGELPGWENFLERALPFLVLSYVYSKQPIFGLTTQEWIREFGGIHGTLHISSVYWWVILLPLA